MHASSCSPFVDPEEVFAAFENAWQSGSPLSIEELVNAVPHWRSLILDGLVHMDLEYRLKTGQAANETDKGSA